MKVSRVAEMQEMDRTAITQFGISEALLMENAGHAVYSAVQQDMGIKDKTFVVVCGSGNNGGDGFVIARKIHSAGGQAKVYVLGEPGRFTGAAKMHLDILGRLPIVIQQLSAAEALAADLRACDAIVDAIFGTGLTRHVEGLYRQVIELLNSSQKPIVSVDIPSGVSGDTGQIMGVAIQAHLTVTFGLPKIGNLLLPGHTCCGTLYVSHISFPPALYNADRLQVALNHPLPLPARPRGAHKGTFGNVLFIAGAAGYFGAPYFAAMSFLKAGGGYARLAAPASMIPSLAMKGSEIVFVPQSETTAGSVAAQNRQALLELAARMDMIVLGPGLSLHEETQQLVRSLVRDIPQPLLLDGDGITAVSQHLDVVKQRQATTIFTPHMGEMSRITGRAVSDLEPQKLDILQDTARQLQSIIVLKGAHSLIGYPDGRVYINLSGNAGMATPGSGDVLTGTIAAMRGLGLDVPEAVRMGVFVHGFAGDLAAADLGEDGLTAQDILNHLPHALKQVREGIPAPFDRRYAGTVVL